MGTDKTAGQSNGLTLETLLDDDDEAIPGRLFARCVVYIDNSSAPKIDPVRAQALRFSLQQVCLTFKLSRTARCSDIPQVRIS